MTRIRRKYPIKKPIVETLYPDNWEVVGTRGVLSKLRIRANNNPQQLLDDFLTYTKLVNEEDGRKLPSIEGFSLYYAVDRRIFVKSYQKQQYSEYNFKKYAEWFEVLDWIRLWIVDNYLFWDSLKESNYDLRNQLKRMEEFNDYKQIEELELKREKQKQDLELQKAKAELELRNLELRNEALEKAIEGDEKFNIIIEGK